MKVSTVQIEINGQFPLLSSTVTLPSSSSLSLLCLQLLLLILFSVDDIIVGDICTMILFGFVII